MSYSPNSLYVLNQDGTLNGSGGNFTTIIPGGLANVTGIDVSEFAMYDLMQIWRNGCFFYHQVDGNNRATPMPGGIVNTVNDLVTLLNTNLANDGYNINNYYFSLSPSAYKLRFNFPIGINFTLLGNGAPIPFTGGATVQEPYKTSIARWIGVGNANVVGDPTLGYVDLPFYYKLIRTTCFYVSSSLNSSDSIIATDSVTAYPDTTTLIKIINTSPGFGSLIYYQASLEDVVSANAVGSTVFQMTFNILDDEGIVMTDLDTETYINMTIRVSYGK